LISTVLHGGMIVDGWRRAAYTTDIAIVGDRIVLIGDLAEREAVRRVDCRGKIVAPGFVDTCSHSDDVWLRLPGTPSKIFQGVTTEIGGMCGRSFPLFGDGTEWPNRDAALSFIESQGTAPNVAFFTAGASHGTSIDTRTAIEAAEEGALGFSLDLQQTRSGGMDAIVEATIRNAHESGAGRCALHLPFDAGDALDTLRTALAMVREYDVALHVSHLHVAYPTPRASIHRALEIIAEARDRGAIVSCDAYPYVATWDGLATLLPAVMQQPDGSAFERLADPQLAAVVAMEMQSRWGDRWNDIVLSEVGSERHLAWCGSRVDEIARAWRLSPARTVLQLLQDEGDAAKAFWFCLNEDDVAAVYSAPFTTVGSAAPAMRMDAESVFGYAHPRTFGTFPRIYGRFVRGRKTLPLEEAVHRMTLLPAHAFGLHQRGEIAVGAYADVVVFNEQTIRDTATYERPISAPAGIEHVYVNGTAVLENGRLTNERPGALLRGGTTTK